MRKDSLILLDLILCPYHQPQCLERSLKGRNTAGPIPESRVFLPYEHKALRARRCCVRAEPDVSAQHAEVEEKGVGVPQSPEWGASSQRGSQLQLSACPGVSVQPSGARPCSMCPKEGQEAGGLVLLLASLSMGSPALEKKELVLASALQQVWVTRQSTISHHHHVSPFWPPNSQPSEPCAGIVSKRPCLQLCLQALRRHFSAAYKEQC
nr:uncharacterized protein LOC114109592 [Ovis aries]